MVDNLKVNLVGLGLAEIQRLIGDLREPPFRARQIYSGIYHGLNTAWDDFSNLPKTLREHLKERYEIAYPPVEQVFESVDGTRRYLFEVSAGQRIESVFIPEEHRDTFCISTQVGCAVGCAYCVTGKLPMRRNLSPGEIIGQVFHLQRERAVATRRLNIVIMGMGEPLHNYDNVMAAIRLMTDEQGFAISPRRITLSTSGVVPAIRRLAAESVIPNLAISLCATTDAARNQLIPINRKWDIAELLDACRAFSSEHRRRITFEYVLIDAVNDTPQDAHRLVSLLGGLKQKINLIPLNPDPWIPMKAPSEERILAFQKILVDRGITASIRRPRGADVAAACGQLAGRKSDTGHRSP